MKKILVALALLTVSTVGLTEDRYIVRVAEDNLGSKMVIIDTKTGDIAWCSIVSCMVNIHETLEPNFKKAFAVAITLEKADAEKYKKKNK